MSKIEKSLGEWTARGLITGEQAKAIIEHESAKPESSWFMSGLLILGAVIVGIGVISLIAANWKDLPDAVKLAADFALLIGLASWAIHSWEAKKPIQFEVLLLSFMLACLASIGLISQIYHTGGHLYQALMLWSLITFAAAAASKNAFVPFMWAGGFISSLVLIGYDSPVFEAFFHKRLPPVFMIIPLACAIVTIVAKSFAGDIGYVRAFRCWTLTSGAIAITIAEVDTSFFSRDQAGLPAFTPGLCFAALAAMAVWQSRDYRKIQKALLIAAIGAFVLLFMLPLLMIKSSIAYAVLTIGVLSLVAIFVASIKEQKLFQWFLFFLGARFMILYFQALGGLAMTGFGLIISGGVVIGAAVLWNKYRKPLAVWAERWAQ